MIRRQLSVIALAVGLGVTPAVAFDIGGMSDMEREAFGEAVRSYLLENPEVLMEAIGVLEARQAAEQAVADDNLVAANADAIFEDGHSYIGGNAEGDVTLVEFIDYRCSFCRRAHPEVSELISSDGSIRKIVKEFPILGPESVEASRFAISVLQVAGGDAYAAIGDALFAHRGNFTREALARIATEQDLDPAPILEAMDSDEVTEIIRQNHALAQELMITGTPTFVVGSTMVRGYVPLDQMREVVAETRGE